MKNLWKIVSYLFLVLVAQRAGAAEAQFETYSNNVKLAFYLTVSPKVVSGANTLEDLRCGIKAEFSSRLFDSLIDQALSSEAQDILRKLIRSERFWNVMVDALKTKATYQEKRSIHIYRLNVAYINYVLGELKEQFLFEMGRRAPDSGRSSVRSESPVGSADQTQALLQRVEEMLRLGRESAETHQVQVDEAPQEVIPDTPFARSWKKFARDFKAQLTSTPIRIVMTPATPSTLPVREAIIGMLITAKEMNRSALFTHTIDTVCLSGDRSNRFWKNVAEGLLRERQTNHVFQVTQRFMDHVLEMILDLTRRVTFKDTYQLIELQAQYLDLATIRALSVSYREVEIAKANESIARLTADYHATSIEKRKWELFEEIERVIAWRDACIEGQKNLRGGGAAATYDPRLRRDLRDIEPIVRGTPQKHKRGKGETTDDVQTPIRKILVAPAPNSVFESDSDDELIPRDEAASRIADAGRTPARTTGRRELPLVPANVTVRDKTLPPLSPSVTMRKPLLSSIPVLEALASKRSSSVDDLRVASPAPEAIRPLTPSYASGATMQERSEARKRWTREKAAQEEAKWKAYTEQRLADLRAKYSAKALHKK